MKARYFLWLSLLSVVATIICWMVGYIGVGLLLIPISLVVLLIYTIITQKESRLEGAEIRPDTALESTAKGSLRFLVWFGVVFLVGVAILAVIIGHDTANIGG